MSILVPANNNVESTGPVFNSLIDAFSFWEQEVDSLFERHGYSIELEDFTAWAIQKKCPPMISFIALKDSEDPVAAFDALKTICITNVGFDAAASFFSEHLDMDINVCDALKEFAFVPKEQRCSIKYFEAIGCKTVRCCISTHAWLCHKHDNMIFSIDDAKTFEDLMCKECSVKWALPYDDTPQTSIQDAIWAAGPWVSDVYYHVDSWLAEGAKSADEYEQAISALREAYCPSNQPHNQALRFRGIAEVLEAKGDLEGAIAAYEMAISIYAPVGVKRKLKSLKARTVLPLE